MGSDDLTARMYFDQGRKSFANQDYDSAADKFKLAVNQDPMFIEAHQYLAESFTKVGYRHRARKAWEALMRIVKNESQLAEIRQKLNEL